MARDVLTEQLLANLQDVINSSEETATSLSKKAGLGESAIRDVMRKPSSSPTLKTVVKLADALGMSPFDLLGMTKVDKQRLRIMALLNGLSEEGQSMLASAAEAWAARELPEESAQSD